MKIRSFNIRSSTINIPSLMQYLQSLYAYCKSYLYLKYYQSAFVNSFWVSKYASFITDSYCKIFKNKYLLANPSKDHKHLNWDFITEKEKNIWRKLLLFHAGNKSKVMLFNRMNWIDLLNVLVLHVLTWNLNTEINFTWDLNLNDDELDKQAEDWIVWFEN